MRKKIPILVKIFYLLIILILAYSVFLSGYQYAFDIDELHNAQIIYLMTQGFKPYSSFFVVYSLFIHWFLTPLFLIFGFSFKTLGMARLVMIIIFAVRVILSFFLVRRLFGKLAGYLFVLLFFLDPFVVFSSMQIRPENLMMVAFTGLLLLLSSLSNKSSKINFLILGVFSGLVLMFNFKIIPSLAVFLSGFIYFTLKNRRTTAFLYFINGFVISFIFYFGYFFINGNLLEMFQQSFLDPTAVNGSIRHVTTLNYFYFSNPMVYGFEGKPASWIYAWLLPPAAFAGGILIFVNILKKKLDDYISLTVTILFIGFVLQWFLMLFVNSVFIQYYIPLSWYYSLFAAVLISYFFEKNLLNIYWKTFLGVVLGLFFIILIRSSILGNINRSKIRGDDYKSMIESIWAKVPENQATFANVLFRPSAYPVIYGSVVSPFMLERYGPVYKYIEKYRINKLYLLSDDFLSYFDLPSQEYIRANFRQDSADPTQWVKLK